MWADPPSWPIPRRDAITDWNEPSPPACNVADPAGNVGGVVIHDDAALENEECIMNNAAPIDARVGIRSHTPARPPRAR
jgi:hypothetical protein